MNGVTLEKHAYLCPCKSSELTHAVSRLPVIEDSVMQRILGPYQDGQTSVLVRSQQVEEIVHYLTGAKNIEQVFIDFDVIKAFTDDSQTTYLALRRGDGFELYQATSEPQYMW